jgi:hypothetical protein
VERSEVIGGVPLKGALGSQPMLPLSLFALPCYLGDELCWPQAQSKGANFPWTETSENVSQNKLSSYKLIYLRCLPQQQKP